MFKICRKKNLNKSTEFSDFIRNASSRVKKRVFSDVLKEATEEQKRVIRDSKSER